MRHTRRQISQHIKEIAAANGVLQATKETFDEQRLDYAKELDRLKDRAQRDRLNLEADLDKLRQQKAAKSANRPATKIQRKIIPDDVEENSAKDLFAIVLEEVGEKERERESVRVRVEHVEQVRRKEQEHQREAAKMKTELKQAFNVEMQNLKIKHDQQLKQQKASMRKQDQDMDALKSELVKKDAEIALLREQNKHFENGRKMYSEQFEFLFKVNVVVRNRYQVL